MSTKPQAHDTEQNMRALDTDALRTDGHAEMTREAFQLAHDPVRQ